MEAAWRNQRESTSLCQDCPGCCAPYPLGGLGTPRSEIMLVGKEPAYNLGVDRVDEEQEDLSWEEARDQLVEDRRREHNPLWRVLTTVADAAECNPTDLYFTNLAKCGGSDSTWVDRRDRCRGYLLREFERVSPAYLVLFGDRVINTVLPMHGLEKPRDGVPHRNSCEALDRTIMTFS